MSPASLALRQVRYTNKAFWRNPVSAFFTFAFPLMFLVIFTVLFGSGRTRVSPTRVVSTSTFYIPAIAAFSVITACYTNIAIQVAFSRDQGVLKRIRGTPLPGWAYLFGRIMHAVFVAMLLVAIVTAFGALFYDAELPTTSLPAFLVTLVVGAASFYAMDLALTYIIPNPDAAPAVVNAIILPLLFISNVFIPLQNPPAWLNALSKIFPIRHFADAMSAAFFTTQGSGFRGFDLLVVAIWGIVGLLAAMRFFSWEPRR